MFEFLRRKKRKTESHVEISEKGITMVINGNVCLREVSIPDAMRIFYALHFLFNGLYTFKVIKTEDKMTAPPTKRTDVELDPKKIDCKRFGGEIDIKYDGRLIYSDYEERASSVYFTLKQVIGEESANKIINDPMGDYEIVI